MQAFVLDHAPGASARAHCDVHVVKILAETTQMLSTARHLLGIRTARHAPRPTHTGHPVVKWACEKQAHRHWLFDYGVALCEEFRYRFDHAHAYEPLYFDGTFRERPPSRLQRIVRYAVAMPDVYRGGDVARATRAFAVQSYRDYYATAKAHLLQYTRRLPPPWLLEKVREYATGARIAYRESRDSDFVEIV